MPLCKGRSKTYNRPCRNYAMKGTDYCKFHGGALIRHSKTAGPRHHSWKHGRRSRYAWLLKIDKLSDSELLSSAPELGLLDALIERQLEELTEGNSLDAEELREQAELVYSAKNAAEKHKTLANIIHTLRKSSWSKQKAAFLLRVIEARAKIAQNERKQLTSEARVITDWELERSLNEVERKLNEYVNEPAARIEIARPFRKVLGVQDSGEIDVEESVEEPFQFDTPA